MKKILLIFLCFCTLEARVVTNTTTKQTSGEGSGLTREEAINNAIIEAIGKLNGISINSIKKSINISTNTNNDTNINDTYSEQINKATKGSADSYEIDSVFEENGKYIANVTIYKTTTTKKYVVPGLNADNRRNISVFNVSHNKIQASLGATLQQKIITELLQSRKFNVLDRDSQGYYDMEKALIKSDNAMSDEVYKLRNVLATDYILLFNISRLDGESKKSNLTGKTKLQVEISIDYRVLLFATRQIKYSNTLIEKFTIKNGILSEDEAIMQKIAYKISTDILNAIYPLKVAEVVNNEVVFSQALNIGDSYECFSLGQAITDSYTKETTGHIETKSGSIEITRTTPKISYGKTTTGSIKKGDICRPLNNSNGHKVGKDPNYKVNEDGGVKLGW